MKISNALCALSIAVVAATGAFAGEPMPKKSLEQAIAIALDRHPDLKAAGATVEAGQQRTWQAISSALPQVTANYSADRRNTSASARTGAPIDGGPGSGANRSRTFNFYSTGVSLSQILFDFGQSLDAIRAARATERSLEADQATARETVLFNVKQSYFSLLTAKRLLDVADENVRQNQKHVDLAQGRFDVGVGTILELTDAQLALTQAQNTEAQALADYRIALAQLDRAAGRR